jgi:5'-phosphate synthase pdxT subunit
MILLSDHAIKTKDGGQALVGGLDVQVCRNYFGSQLQSCEAILDTRVRGPGDSSTCRAVFIRAPAILTAGEGVDVLATITARPHPSAEVQVREALEGGEKKEVKTGALKRSAHDVQKSNKRSKIDENRETKEERPDFEPTVIVAARQGNILATAFHPELTTDDRWHRYAFA